MRAPGPLGSAFAGAVAKAKTFLDGRPAEELLRLVGSVREDLALSGPVADKVCFPAGYRDGKDPADDLVTGLGMFYVTQAGKVMLDCTSGHYQMT